MALERISAIIARDPLQKQSKRSLLEDRFKSQLVARRLPPFEQQLRFAKHVGRQWRFDFSWQPFMVAVEIDGLVVRRIGGQMVCMGAHATAQGIRDDMDKHNAAIMLGWSVLRFEATHIRDGVACDVTYRVLVAKGWDPK